MVVLVAPVFQRKVGAATGEPPVTEAVAEPLLPPKQLTLLLMPMFALNAEQSAAVMQAEKTEVLLLAWVLVAMTWVPLMICPAERSSCQMPVAGVVTVPSKVLP